MLSWLIGRPRAASRPVRALRIEALEDRTVPATLIPGFTQSTFASGINEPTSMAFAPDGRLFVTEKGTATAGTGNTTTGTASVRVVQPDGTLLASPFLTVPVNSFSERGLNGLAFDPNFATNGFVYVYYTTADATPVNRVSRFTADPANPNIAKAGSEVVLLDNIPSINGNHNGGGLHFGNDGMLYIGVGESGVSSNAQDLSTLAGKVLRIAPDGSIPADNPFVGVAGARPEIYAYGFRNPFTFNVDPNTGTIYINDVGEATFEEINQLVKGGNYGWNQAEGPSNNPNFINPVSSYNHNGQGAAITGGVFSRGTSSFPAAFQGGYFFADFVQSFIRYLPPGATQAVDFATNAVNPVDLDIGPDGRLYVLSIGNGTVTRIDALPGFLQIPRIVASPAGAGGQVTIFDATTQALQQSFTPYPGYSGGVRVAMADVNGDGFDDIITAPAAGAPPHVKVFDGQTLAELASFYAFDPRFLGGIEIAGGDINKDGFADVIVGAGPGADAHVAAFDIQHGGAEIRSFDAFAAYAGGVRVAAGDVNGDGFADIIVGAGPGGNGHVKVFDGQSNADLASFFAYPGGFVPQGVLVGAGDIDGDGVDEVLTGTGAGTLPHVKAFSIPSFGEKASFYAFGTFTGGVRVSAVDVNGDGHEDIVVGAASGPPHVKAFDAATLATLDSFFAFNPAGFAAGVDVAAG